jgi:cell filamentation protein
MHDPYIIDENGVLRNKLSITDYHELNRAERDITFVKFLDIDTSYKQQFNAQYFKSIHKHIFEDIFDWAGEYRTVPIVKEEVVLPGLSLDYADAKDIDKKLKSCLKTMNDTNWDAMPLDKKIAEFTNQLTSLWSIHPFRDGNTRTFLSFAYIFAKANGFPFDMELFTKELNRTHDEDGKVINYSVRDRFVLASLDDDHYPEVGPLASLFKAAMLSYEENMKKSGK